MATKTKNGKFAVGLSTADRINAEIKYRRNKIDECETIIDQMEDEIAKLVEARNVTVAPDSQYHDL